MADDPIWTPAPGARDIPLANESRIDPKLNTPWYAGARQMAKDAQTPKSPTRTGGVRQAVSQVRNNWRTFVKGGR